MREAVSRSRDTEGKSRHMNPRLRQTTFHPSRSLVPSSMQPQRAGRFGLIKATTTAHVKIANTARPIIEAIRAR